MTIVAYPAVDIVLYGYSFKAINAQYDKDSGKLEYQRLMLNGRDVEGVFIKVLGESIEEAIIKEIQE